MKSNGRPESGEKKLKFKPSWILYVLVVAVLLLSILAFISPICQNPVETTPSPTTQTTATDIEGETIPDVALTTTPEAYPLPPTPEEIGYTDGIIFLSTILILILLVATLREILYRKAS